MTHDSFSYRRNVQLRMKTSVTFSIFALCLLFSSTWSIKVDKSFKTTSYLREFERFGFDKGGTANIKGKKRTGVDVNR